MLLRRSLILLAPAAFLATGCLATRGDIERLELALRTAQTESAQRQARSDSAGHALLRQATQMLAAQFTREFNSVSDSVRQVASSLQRLQGDVTLAMHDVRAQLTTLQEGIGQSQRRLQDLRTSVEAREAVQPPRPADAAAPAAAPGTPPASQLFQLGEQQARQNATSAARMNFQTLIDQYPTHDRAPEAQHKIALTYASEGNRAAADSVHALVVTTYPNSSSAPASLFKRARLAQDLKDTARAKAFFEQIVAKYPKSLERELADDELLRIKP
jgi:TolA-binding protein